MLFSEIFTSFQSSDSNKDPYSDQNSSKYFEKAFQEIFPMFEEKEEEKSISEEKEEKSISNNLLKNDHNPKALITSKNDIDKDKPTISLIEENEEFNDIHVDDTDNVQNVKNISDINQGSSEGKKQYFEETYQNKYSVFTNSGKKPALVKNEKSFLRRKRLQKRRKRKENLDNIRIKINRDFNNKLTGRLNEKLETNGIKIKLKKFPENLVKDVNQKRGKTKFNMTLNEYMRTKSLYIYKNDKNNSLKKYKHNLEILENEKVKNNEEFKKILKKKILELYEEYINSDEFKNEINRLEKNNDDDYMETYVYIANHLPKFFSS